MKLFVIILCLLSERYLMHSLSYKRFIWFDDYCNKITKLTVQYQLHNPWILLMAYVVPVVIMVAIFYYLLHTIFFGFIGFLLNLLIFFYCLGPKNPFYPITGNPDESQSTSIANYFAEVNSELFAVIFWFIIGGPIALLVYRFISLSCMIEGISAQAKQVTDILEWIPARMSVFLYLLVGNFQRGLSLFIHYLPAKPALNNQILAECGMLAVQSTETQELSIVDAERLIEHAVFVLLFFVALFTLISW